jgi:hypothetical protein
MDRAVSRLSEWMARPTSRRGFMGRVSKAALGSAALMSGGVAAVALGGGTAHATPQCCNGAFSCGSTCPGNTSRSYVTTCCNLNGDEYNCYNCLSSPSGDYVCTIAVFFAHNCPMAPARQ